MIRKFCKEEQALFCSLADEFYHSPAVLHPVDPAHFMHSFQAAMEESPYLDLYLILQEEQPAGYGLVLRSFSNEAGGEAIWIDELYLRPAYQGLGLGSAFLHFVHAQYPQAKRFRLEIEETNTGAARLYERMGYKPLDYRQMVRDC